MTLFTLFLLLLPLLVRSQADCPTPTTQQDRRTDSTRLRVGTFNTEWLFEGNDTYSPWTSRAAADQHLAQVAAAIAAKDPDILSLQEVQNCLMLNRLIDLLDKVHGLVGYKPYMVKGTDTATGQNVGFITRIDPLGPITRSDIRVSYPISGNTCGSTTASGTSAVSKHYIAQFKINGAPVTMYGQHFLAYPTDPPRCVQREAQASVMRTLINTAISNNQDIIVFGDYNDYSDKIPDSVNDIPTSRVMKILRQGLVGELENGTDYLQSSGVPPTLNEISALIPQSERYTNAYGTNSVSMIDHLLVSQSIYTNILSTFIDHSYARATVSDHWPFYADIKTPWAF